MRVRAKKLINKIDNEIAEPTTQLRNDSLNFENASAPLPQKLLSKHALQKYAQLAKYLHFYGIGEYKYCSREICNSTRFVTDTDFL